MSVTIVGISCIKVEEDERKVDAKVVSDGDESDASLACPNSVTLPCANHPISRRSLPRTITLSSRHSANDSRSAVNRPWSLLGQLCANCSVLHSVCWNPDTLSIRTARKGDMPQFDSRDGISRSLPALSPGGSLHGPKNDKAPTYRFGAISHRCVPQMSYCLARCQWFLACS